MQAKHSYRGAVFSKISTVHGLLCTSVCYSVQSGLFALPLVGQPTEKALCEVPCFSVYCVSCIYSKTCKLAHKPGRLFQYSPLVDAFRVMILAMHKQMMYCPLCCALQWAVWLIRPPPIGAPSREIPGAGEPQGGTRRVCALSPLQCEPARLQGGITCIVQVE